MTNRAILIEYTGLEGRDLGYLPTLQQAQEIVGGYVESIEGKDEKRDKLVTLLVNEEGRLESLPLNIRASVDYSVKSKHFPLVGNVIALYGWKELKQEETKV